MLADPVRGAAYLAALRRSVKPDMVVADIGAGPGVLGIYAATLGARRVFLVEPDASVNAAYALAAENGVADRIEVIRASSTEIELPERADVIVSDLRGVTPFHGHHLEAAADMRRRLLAAGRRLHPASRRRVHGARRGRRAVRAHRRRVVGRAARARARVAHLARRERLVPRARVGSAAALRSVALRHARLRLPDAVAARALGDARDARRHGARAAALVRHGARAGDRALQLAERAAGAVRTGVLSLHARRSRCVAAIGCASSCAPCSPATTTRGAGWRTTTPATPRATRRCGRFRSIPRRSPLRSDHFAPRRSRGRGDHPRSARRRGRRDGRSASSRDCCMIASPSGSRRCRARSTTPRAWTTCGRGERRGPRRRASTPCASHRARRERTWRLLVACARHAAGLTDASEVLDAADDRSTIGPTSSVARRRTGWCPGSRARCRTDDVRRATKVRSARVDRRGGQRVRRAHAGQVRRLGEAGRSSLADVGVTALPYKGPVLSLQLYGDLALRQSVDLDLVVPFDAYDAARAALVRRGLPPRWGHSRAAGAHAVRLARPRAVRRRRRVRRAALALRRPALPLRARRGARRCAARSRSASRDACCRSCAADDLLAVLSMHAARHLYERLEWVVGVTRLLVAAPMGPASLMARAETLRARRMLAVSVHVAARLLDFPLDDAWRRALAD